MRNRFAAAPWSGLLKSTSIVASLSLVAAGCVVARAVPAMGGSHLLSGLIACSLPAIALATALFVVIDYQIDGARLNIRRLLWYTRIDLAALQEVRADPDVLRGSIRTAGNGGLFSFTGYYRNQRLGSYEAYVTDWKHAVTLRLARRVIVVSPADPAWFVIELRALFPQAAGSS